MLIRSTEDLPYYSAIYVVVVFPSCEISQWRAKDFPIHNDGVRDLR